MIFSKDSVFYRKAVALIEEFIADGKKTVDDLGKNDKAYLYIKNSKVYNEKGEALKLDEIFELLGYPRKRKVSLDVREDLIKEINDYINNGGSFHIPRKQLPFYSKLHTYSKILARKGIFLTHEEIMKNDLGFKEYSETYYRYSGVEKLKNYRDDDGYVDSYRRDKVMFDYIIDVAVSLEIPYYLVITLLANENARSYYMSVDKLKFVKIQLENYLKIHGSFIGLKRKDKSLYYAFDHLTRYYSDGNETLFSKKEWLALFGLDDAENRFKASKEDEYIDVTEIMSKLKMKHGDNKFYCKDIDINDYRKIIKKSVRMGIPVPELFKLYGLNVEGTKAERLTQTKVKEIPYLDEMKKRRDEIIKSKLKKDLCKEEIFEIRVGAVKQVYREYKDLLNSYLPESEIEEISEVTDEV